MLGRETVTDSLWSVQSALFGVDDIAVNDERLIRQMRQEARLFQEDVEADVAEHAASERTMREALIDFGKRGCDVRVDSGDRWVAGRIEHVGASMFRIVTAQGRVVDIGSAGVGGIRRLPGTARPGSVSTGHPGSIMARLREAVQTQESLHVERVGGEAVDGCVVAVLEDAVELESTIGTWLVPIGAILWLWRP